VSSSLTGPSNKLMLKRPSGSFCYTNNMRIKNRKTILPILLIVLLIIGAFVILKDTGVTKSVKVLDYGYSVCTMDIPSSSCGPYEVNVESSDGQKSTYEVAGFDNDDSEQYYKITSKIVDSKESNKTVELQVNNNGEITAVR